MLGLGAGDGDSHNKLLPGTTTPESRRDNIHHHKVYGPLCNMNIHVSIEVVDVQGGVKMVGGGPIDNFSNGSRVLIDEVYIHHMTKYHIQAGMSNGPVGDCSVALIKPHKIIVTIHFLQLHYIRFAVVGRLNEDTVLPQLYVMVSTLQADRGEA